jgi:hypothetical protein
LKPYSFLTVLGLLLFGDLVLHPSQVLYSGHSDLLAMHLPMKRFLVRSWQQTGEVPLWCPYSFGGMPFLHDVQVAAFYPPHLPLYLLPEDWLGAALSWLVVAHVILAGWCMYAYATSQGLGRTAAVVAACGYMFGGKWLLHILAGGHYIMAPLAWLPLVLLTFELSLRRRSLLWATVAGSIFGLIVLGTHPQMTLYAGVFIALWTFGPVLREMRRRGDKETRRQGEAESSFGPRFALSPCLRWLGFGAWTAGVAAALAAVQLLPALEAAPEASRAVGVSAGNIAAVAVPSLLGLVGPAWTAGWEARAGLGVFWITAALVAPLLCRAQVRYQAAVSLLLLFFGVGGAALVQWLPGFRMFQIPVRMLMLLALPVALLAGHTTQVLFADAERGRDARRTLRRFLRPVFLAGAGLSATCALLNFFAWQREQTAIEVSPLKWLHSLDGHAEIYWAVVLVAVPICFWMLSERCTLSREWWATTWLVILLADLWALTWPQVAVRPAAEVYASSTCVQELVTVAREHPEERWRVLDRGLPGLPSSSPLGSALPMLGNIALEPVLGYNSFDVRRYKEYLQFILDEDRPIRPREGLFGYPVLDGFPIRNKRLLDLLGVRYLLQPREGGFEFTESGEPARNSAWTKRPCDTEPRAYSFLAGGMQDLPAYDCFENRDAYPRAFLVPQAAPLADRAHVLEQLKSTDFRRVVLLEGASPAAEVGTSASADTPRSARLREYLPDRVTVETQAPTPGYLVLADLWFPGWACTVDGQATALARADFLFRAVAVPAGTHEVVFRFEPASYHWGKRISSGALLLVLSCVLLGLLRVQLMGTSQKGLVAPAAERPHGW